MQILMDIIQSSWDVLLESSIYMLFGLLISAVLRAVVPQGFVARHLGGNGPWSVIKAAVIGAPIPLCSCGVVPVAADLRKRGAGKGATASFLVATPETGADSIAITYALLDPLMALLRPLAAVVSAIAAGLAVNKSDTTAPVPPAHEAGGCGCGSTSCADQAPGMRPLEITPPLSSRFRSGLDFAFGELLADIGVWFLGGVLVAGMITALVPDDLISRYLGSGITPMLVMLAAGIPMYVCATSSTPVAAALALKGLSPGAALVFLLAGPATNAASLAVVSKVLGKKAAMIILAAIAACSIGLGLLVNWIYAALGLSVTQWVATDSQKEHGIVFTLAAIILTAMIVRAKLSGHGHAHHGGCCSEKHEAHDHGHG